MFRTIWSHLNYLFKLRISKTNRLCFGADRPCSVFGTRGQISQCQKAKPSFSLPFSFAAPLCLTESSFMHLLGWQKYVFAWRSVLLHCGPLNGAENNTLSRHRLSNFSACYGRNICVPPKLTCWNLNPSVWLILGGGAFWRQLGLEGKTLINGIYVLIRRDGRACFAVALFSEARTQWKGGRGLVLDECWICQDILDSRTGRKKCLLCQPLSRRHFCYGGPNRLRQCGIGVPGGLVKTQSVRP